MAADYDRRVKGPSVFRRVEVAGVFRPPSAPGDAAAARAALTGVTRLELRGRFNECAQLAAALAHLPGLRAASLVCGVEVQPPREAPPREADEIGAGELSDDDDELGGYVGEYGQLGIDLAAMLAGCPSIESLEWDIEGSKPAGALGSQGGRRTL
jgi:hypothetical protein